MSYLEFGTVVALSKRDVEIQTTDPRVGRTVQRSFALSRETRADVVHVGETVELIYAAGEGGYVLERLIALHGEVPKIGPAPSVVASAGPTAGSPGSAMAGAAVPSRSSTNLGRALAALPPGRTAAAGTTLPRNAPASSGPAGTPQPVALGGAPPARVPGVISVPMGSAAATVNAVGPKVKNVTTLAIGEECNRTADWSAQPITLAVLDFRYPTEREEAHDIGSVGGGAGTAVADLAYARLSDDPKLAVSRGDRQKLFRMDFAGAARVGRQLGVDLVLLGTFAPVEISNADPDFPPATQAYTFRAGVVETCTGELLYRLSSVTCPVAPAGTVAPTCPASQVSTREASAPEANAAAFKVPLDILLTPLIHDGTPVGMTGTSGVVSAIAGITVTVRLTGGLPLAVGDQVGIRAFRLAKNPTTNTLHVYRDEEIGRITVQRVSGGLAVGSYLGDTPPLVGDTADKILQ